MDKITEELLELAKSSEHRLARGIVMVRRHAEADKIISSVKDISGMLAEVESFKSALKALRSKIFKGGK